MKKDRVVVIIESQEQLDKVRAWLDPDARGVDSYTTMKSSYPGTPIAKSLYERGWTRASWYIDNKKDTVISFQEFEKEYLGGGEAKEIFSGVRVGDVLVYTTECNWGEQCSNYRKGSIERVDKASGLYSLVIVHNGKRVGGSWSSMSHHRIATAEEVEAYKRGVRHIDDIKPPVFRFAVGDEVEFIVREGYTSVPEYYTNYDSIIPENLITHGTTIFKENRGVVKAIHHKPGGDVYYIVEYIDINGKATRLGFLADSLRLKVPKPVSSAAVIAENVRERLFEEAKQRYPVGTTFKVVHLPHTICTVRSHERHNKTFVWDGDTLHVNLLVDRVGTAPDSASVYYNSKWAEIVDADTHGTTAVIRTRTADREGSTFQKPVLISRPEERKPKLVTASSWVK